MLQEGKHIIQSPQEEIAELRQRITELEGNTHKGGKEKKEIAREAVREHFERASERISPHQKFTPAKVDHHAKRIAAIRPKTTPHARTSDDIVMDEHRPDIQKLLQLVEQEGIWNALAVVQRIGNPHLEDDFHDALIQYLQMHNA